MRDVAADLAPGRATPEGTSRFAARFPDLPEHFRRPDRLAFSSIALGTRRGDPGGVDDLLYREALALLLAGGVNVFATALSDRGQASERNLGAALERAFREGVAARDEVVVATRGGALAIDAELVASPAQARRYLVETYVETGLVDPSRLAGGGHCFDPAFLRDQIARSRRNLRLETIDLYLLEDIELLRLAVGADEFRRRLRDAFVALESAVADGWIGAYGLASWDGFLRPHTDRAHVSVLDAFEWALDIGGGDHHLRALQIPYSLAMAEALKLPSQLAPTGRTDALLGALRGTGTAILASAPLVQGRALGRLPDFVADAFPELRTDAQRCLQFARSAPGITSAVVGMREPDHVRENLALARVPPARSDIVESLFKRAASGETG